MNFDKITAYLDYSVILWPLHDLYLPALIIQLLSLVDTHYGETVLLEKILIFFSSLNTVIVYALELFDIIAYFNLSTTSLNALCIAIKFLGCIAFLIFARGGIPRFRFDYLTKLGWIRFLSLVLLSFLIELLLLSMM